MVGDYTPRVAKSGDGKLWFLSPDGISVVDPHQLPFNKLPPPVHIEKVAADRKEYGKICRAMHHRIPACPRWCAIWRSTIRRSASSRRRKYRFVTSWKAGIVIGRTRALAGKRSTAIFLRAITLPREGVQ